MTANLLLLALLVILIAAATAFVFSVNALLCLLRDRVPYVPTPAWAIHWMVKHVHLTDGLKVYDLGCGDGRVLRALKGVRPGIVAIGFELAWWPYLLAKWRSRKSDIILRRQSFYRANLYDADVIFCFLMTSLMPKVEGALRGQLRSGTTIISYAFPFPTWQPAEVVTNPKKPNGSKLYIYRA